MYQPVMDRAKPSAPRFQFINTTYARLVKQSHPRVASFLIPGVGHATLTLTPVNYFPSEHRQPNMEPRDMIGERLYETEEKWNAPPTGASEANVIIQPHQHYRLILGTVRKNLTNFSSTKELVSAVRDAAVAHGRAWNMAEILHRDISVGNIVITTNGHGDGVLIDWDLAKSVSSLGGVQRQFERTSGTRQFTSATLLQEPNKPPEFADDLESFFLTLVWTLLRFSGSNISPTTLAHLLKDVFDGYDSLSYGGSGTNKKYYLGMEEISDTKFESESINELMCDLAPVFAARYSVNNLPRKKPRSTEDEFSLATQVWEGVQEVKRLDRERLKTPRWFVAVLDDVLEALSWPSNDGAERRVLWSGKKGFRG